MTVPFSQAQKFRILVRFEAQIIFNGALIPVSRFAYGTESDEKRFRLLRRQLNCVVKCACGCETWAPLRDIDFDHERAHVSGGLTSISNGRPLRRTPCHAAKSASEQEVTGWVTRVRNKLSVTTGLREDDSISPETRPSRRSWPARPLTNPNWKRTFSGRVERRA